MTDKELRILCLKAKIGKVCQIIMDLHEKLETTKTHFESEKRELRRLQTESARIEND